MFKVPGCEVIKKQTVTVNLLSIVYAITDVYTSHIPTCRSNLASPYIFIINHEIQDQCPIFIKWNAYQTHTRTMLLLAMRYTTKGPFD